MLFDEDVIDLLARIVLRTVRRRYGSRIEGAPVVDRVVVRAARSGSVLEPRVGDARSGAIALF
ncbi:hypothetical protein [Natrialba sp. PRR66]|uniref:hypothetical protein n=1 Tax=Natrialba sp. PRR66 TaxID=3098146 RepID=UPI002B1E28B0|nr:hypothetical protein [Natrialba sp. PRR66]